MPFQIVHRDILKNIFNIFFYLGVFLKKKTTDNQIFNLVLCSRQVINKKKCFVFINRTGCQGSFKDTFIRTAFAVCVLIKPVIMISLCVYSLQFLEIITDVLALEGSSMLNCNFILQLLSTIIRHFFTHCYNFIAQSVLATPMPD